jgi:HEPN domain-containing protein
MNNRERADFLLREAGENLDEAFNACEDGSWNRVIRRSQEAVELALKALFKLVNVEYPKVHDVAPVLEKVLTEKDIVVDHATMDKVKMISKSLAEKRAPAFYGEQMYSQNEALEAKEGAKEVVSFAKDLAKTLF